MSSNSQEERISLAGAAGALALRRRRVDGHKGVALIAHPHPLFGGTPDNKVVTIMAKAAQRLGYTTLCPSFRGVAGSEGVHDHGVGESEDMLQILRWAENEGPQRDLLLMGFSFGAYVQSRVCSHLLTTDSTPWRLCALVLVGMAAGEVLGARQYTPPTVPPHTLLVHGEKDEVVPLAQLMEWVRPQNIPVTILPGADHFFHRRLAQVQAAIEAHVLYRTSSLTT